MSSGLYSDNVKKFIEENIEDIENMNLSPVLILAHITLDQYECNVLADILDKVIDDFDKFRKEALIAMISNKLLAFSLGRNDDNISIPAFVYTYLKSTFNLSAGEVVQLIYDNKEKWPNQIKWDPSLKNWRVFK